MGLNCISLLIAIGSIAIIPHGALGQSSVPRTPWGSPDLGGIWNHGTATPLERPDHHAGRERLDDHEIAELNAQQRASDGALVQYNSSLNTVSANVRFRWEYRPGSEFFVVLNEQRDTETRRFPGLVNRALILKFNRLFRF